MVRQKKVRRVIVKVRTGVAPHALLRWDVADALGVKKLANIHQGGPNGPVIGYEADEIKPYREMILTSSMDANGVEYRFLNFSMPGVPN